MRVHARQAALGAAALLASAGVAVAAATAAPQPYPSTLPPSCWARVTGGGLIRYAPSVFPKPPRVAPSPDTIVRRVLDRFGDNRFVVRVELGKRPPITFQHTGYFRHSQPPANALWAYVATHGTSIPDRAAQPTSEFMLAEWEVGLVMGALRDEFCTAGGRPLVGWSTGGSVAGISDAFAAFNQRFPNPSPSELRARLAALGDRFGFRVVSLRLLHPLQLAPAVVVTTDRDRNAFVEDVAAIVRGLDPVRESQGVSGPSFEGVYFEARDANGAFVRVTGRRRGVGTSSQWSSDPCHYPYATHQIREPDAC